MTAAPLRLPAGLRAIGIVGIVAWGSLGPARAQSPPAAPADDPTARELVVGIKEAAPFAVKNADGSWSGISIDLWRRIADQLHLRYRFREEPLQQLLDDTAAGRVDAAVSAITVTAAREQVLDFSQPYYFTGLGIATPERGRTSLWTLVRAMVSVGFVKTVLGIAALLFGVGALMWLAERRRNRQFGPGAARGLGSAFWWSAVTMTTVGYGDKAPVTAAGRAVAIGWMFASVIMISGVTAGITTTLTTAQIRGLVTGPNDLSAVRVGSIAASSSADYLNGRRIVFADYPTVRAGLEALRTGTIHAFVYDRPLLQWEARQHFPTGIEVLPASFDRQSYAIALPNGSRLRETVNRALLDIIQSDWWQRVTFDYLGES
jgi:ABC-type amino acid transport substrate-binding protein